VIFSFTLNFFRGDEIVVGDMDKKISELEERASELDKARTQTIQSISYINDRNRKRNVERAEEAILVTTVLELFLNK
jgi:RNA polymerase-associated protein RTF1